MADFYFDASFDALEVCNEFPILKKSLERFSYDVHSIQEGETFGSFLSRQELSEDEVDFLLRRLNLELKRYLKSEENSNERMIELIESPAQLSSQGEEE